jgi:hypothetical protein
LIVFLKPINFLYSHNIRALFKGGSIVNYQKIHIYSLLFFHFIFATQLICQVSFTGSELLGRPTNNSITLNVIADMDIDAYVEYGTTSGSYPDATSTVSGTANEPLEIVIDGLEANTRYYYRLGYSADGGANWVERDEHSFHTKRAATSTFTFTVISDSHLGGPFNFNNTTLYTIACQNVSNDNPDLHFDLGDTFPLTGTATGDVYTIHSKYMAQRPYMGLFTHSTPIFLVIGNHEEEEGWNLDDAGSNYANSLPVMSTNARKRYFVNPIPDDFYTGNSDASQLEIDNDHLHENYYAFKWGSALFIAIDPYWYTMTKPFWGTTGREANDEIVGDRWDWTLGEEQYEWLKQTLEQSTSKHKFVFAHQVAGGTSDYGRGGAEATSDYEWGANPTDFATNRTGWSSNIAVHQLFLDNGVDIFFHGHDHVYAMEQVDGMIYQECPHPAQDNYGTGFGEYTNNPPTTIVKNNSGHIRVTVSPTDVIVEYIRAFLPGDGTNGQIEHRYSVTNVTNVEEEEPARPNRNWLDQNYPNPFNPSTTIVFDLPKTSHTSLKIFNVLGEEIATLISDRLPAGSYSYDWDAGSLASGIYLYRLSIGSLTTKSGHYVAGEAGNFVETRKMVLMR